ncbi:hypothetical protein LTR78_007213 [Recurvomyces mirabilis]|uniref:Uncharacterized protein n=1 Tax=Recurvomyces mirabilis TaxID=574656 RepID=A0AAE0WJH7_9PEZI|nr:hypothetical protein LTR78_007213 [Recurvomyces mirabilis]KAK5155544.1 hypothetical protein LTS14_005805 [Recurvomyces mirabilis]
MASAGTSSRRTRQAVVGESSKRSLRERAATPSYVDPETDDEDELGHDYEPASPPAPRKAPRLILRAPQRPQRQVRPIRQATKRYVEPDSDDESEDEGVVEPAQRSSRSSGRLTRQTATSYAEPDSDDDVDDEAEFVPVAPPQLQHRQEARAPPRKRRKVQARPRPQTRLMRGDKGKAAVKSVLRGIGKKRRWNTVGAPPKQAFTGPSDKKIPDWASLPINILRDIFIFASQPVHEQTRTASANVDRLLKTARLSPLLNNLQPHHLLELLQIPKEKRCINYNAKVKSLQIDVRRLAYTATGRGLFDISLLVAECPQLQQVEILHPVDEPPFRPLKIQNWHYPANFFESLEEHGTKLRSWRWNRDMINIIDASEMYALMVKTHSGKSFEYLTKLTLCGYDWNDSAEPAEAEGGATSAATAPGLATSIGLIPRLKDLTFISCEVLVDNFLERLPTNLERLEITNCLELTSGMLQSYLLTGGSQVRELVLNHNPALNLTFLTSLKTACPKLEVLKMDLRLFSEKINSNDAEPLYEELLGSEDIPTWPSTLRHLELTQLNRWQAEAAQNLFRSVVDNSADLPDLRILILHSHINIPWRQRAEFRDQWIDRLHQVYARRADAPNPYLGSLRQFAEWKAAQAVGWDIKQNGRAKPDDPEAPGDFVVGRGISHVQMSSPKRHDGDTDVFSESSPEKQDGDKAKVRRSTRVKESVARVPLSATGSDSGGEEEDEDDEQEDQTGLHVQGLCNIVDIRIDNQRPRENEFTAGDFLDDEISGDEDWQEGNDNDADDGYAW